MTMISMVNDEKLCNDILLESTKNCKERIEYMPLYSVTHPTKAYNEAIEKAQHDLIVCVHQDVKFLVNFAECLETWLSKLQTWGVCGLAGTISENEFVTSNFAPDDHRERKITRVMTIDSLCIILDKRKPLRFDEEFVWWHFFTEDLAMQANHAGLGTYVLPCCFKHLSSRTYNALPDHGGYYPALMKMKKKWRMHTPIYTTIGTI